MLGNYHPEPVLATLTQGLAGRENYDISTSRLTAARSASELPTHFNKFFNPLLVKEGAYFQEPLAIIVLVTFGGQGGCRSHYVVRRQFYRLLRLPIRYLPI